MDSIISFLEVPNAKKLTEALLFCANLLTCQGRGRSYFVTNADPSRHSSIRCSTSNRDNTAFKEHAIIFIPPQNGSAQKQTFCAVPYGTESRLFYSNWVNTMATDGLAPHVTKSLAVMILNMEDKQVFVFY